MKNSLFANRLNQAVELDMLNRIVFGMTAREWKRANPALKGNIRDHANELQLIVLNNLQAYNGYFIRKGYGRPQREKMLLEVATFDMQVLFNKEPLKALKP